MCRLVSQIIHRIKRQNDSSITGNIEDICDRIFELVDKNNDSKLHVNDLLFTESPSDYQQTNRGSLWSQAATSSGHSDYDKNYHILHQTLSKFVAVYFLTTLPTAAIDHSVMTHFI